MQIWRHYAIKVFDANGDALDDNLLSFDDVGGGIAVRGDGYFAEFYKSQVYLHHKQDIFTTVFHGNVQFGRNSEFTAHVVQGEAPQFGVYAFFGCGDQSSAGMIINGYRSEIEILEYDYREVFTDAPPEVQQMARENNSRVSIVHDEDDDRPLLFVWDNANGEEQEWVIPEDVDLTPQQVGLQGRTAALFRAFLLDVDKNYIQYNLNRPSKEWMDKVGSWLAERTIGGEK